MKRGSNWPPPTPPQEKLPSKSPALLGLMTYLVNQTPCEDLVNKDSNFSDFVRSRPLTYKRTQQPLCTLWATIIFRGSFLKRFFIADILILWKSDSPVFTTHLLWKTGDLGMCFEFWARMKHFSWYFTCIFPIFLRKTGFKNILWVVFQSYNLKFQFKSILPNRSFKKKKQVGFS